jgi:hypothetical protein
MTGLQGSTIAVLGALACALAAGCGGGSEAAPASAQQSSVRSVLARFERARAIGDAEAACRQLVAVEERGRIEVEREGDSADAENGSCASAFEQATAARRALRGYAERVQRITVHGDTARAEGRVRAVRSDGSVLSRPVVYDLVRRDGWRLILRVE